MNIPCNFNPLGYTLAPAGELPAGYTRLAFLESTGSQYIVTDIFCDDDNIIECSYQTPSVSGSSALYVFGTITPVDRIWAWGEFGTSETNRIGYSWQGYRGVSRVAEPSRPKGRKYIVKLSKNLFELGGSVLAEISNTAGNASVAGDTPRPLVLFGINDATIRKFSHKIWWLQHTSGAGAETHFVPAINPAGTPGMFDKATQTFFANDGAGLFICGIETIKQLQQLASNLPTVTGAPGIKLSVPGEWNGGAAANELLAAINAKGWVATITYREAAASSASSYVFGGRGDGGAAALVIWCRATESAQGNYQDAAGVRYYVETCHDVWHPDGLSPDDLGYTEASTLEDYLAAAGLAAVEYEEKI